MNFLIYKKMKHCTQETWTYDTHGELPWNVLCSGIIQFDSARTRWDSTHTNPVCVSVYNLYRLTKSPLTAGSHRPSTRGNSILRSICPACISKSDNQPDLFKIFDLDTWYRVTYKLGCWEFCNVNRVSRSSEFLSIVISYSFQWRSQPDIWSCKCKFFCVYDRIRNQCIKKWIIKKIENETRAFIVW